MYIYIYIYVFICICIHTYIYIYIYNIYGYLDRSVESFEHELVRPLRHAPTGNLERGGRGGALKPSVEASIYQNQKWIKQPKKQTTGRGSDYGLGGGGGGGAREVSEGKAPRPRKPQILKLKP